jgi:hypothetical protein
MKSFVTCTLRQILLKLSVKDDIGRECNMHVENRKEGRVLVGKLEGKRALRRPRFKWEDHIKTNLRDTG